MSKQIFANNAVSTLSGTLPQGGTTLVCSSGQGSRFPTPGAGEFFLLTIFTKDTYALEQEIEVVKVTARTGDVMTIERDVENLTGVVGGNAYNSSVSTAYLELRWTALGASSMLQLGANLADLASIPAALGILGIPAAIQDSTYETLGTVAGVDVITAVAAPTLTGYVAGQTFRFLSAGANTANSVTLNIDALGAKAIKKAGITGLVDLDIGDIPAAGIALQVTYDGTQFQIISGAVASESTTLKTIQTQLGLSGTPANNFTLDASADNGTMKLARGNAGATTQDIMNVKSSGQVLFPNNTRTWKAKTLTGGVTYTNNNDHEIQLNIVLSSPSGKSTMALNTDGMNICVATAEFNVVDAMLIGSIPPGQSFTVSGVVGSVGTLYASVLNIGASHNITP